MPYLIDAHHIGARQTGNETWIRNICSELTALTDAGELCFAASARGVSELRELTAVAPVVVSENPWRRLVFDLPRAARRLAANATLVQYTMPLGRPGPCVVMVHDLSVFDPQSKDWVPRKFRLRVQMSIRDSVRRAASLLAPSEFTRQQLVDGCGVDPDKIAIAPNATDPGLLRSIEAARREARPARAGGVVLAVGNVLPRKNLGVLGEAIALLRVAGEDVRLRVVGSVPREGEKVAARLRAQLDDAVAITGYASREDLAREYAHADVLAFPSLFEGFGIPVVEAYAAGLPVVVSDRGSLAEVAGTVGVVVPAEDPGRWATALAEQLAQGVNVGAAARRARAASYTWETSARVVLGALRGARR